MHSFEKRRYAPSKSELKLLPALVECGRHAVSAFINVTRAGLQRHARPVSCEAYAMLPATKTTAKRRCYRRASRIGGLEMSVWDLESSTRQVEGYCQESGQRLHVF
uniref:Uncharacterized protein n=1 Tax=Haptolina brevifila TaxID=156173 RepID=A0A7S2DE71_9EUKA|mmetsp:Transcript_36089/g.71755  ORF Transcript_36089/g.71755 Transcript_36089/m.71755 type:complete len:106 (+) Transcript_36089:254-571(+)